MTPTRAPHTVGVYGGGRMGAGIAYAFIAAGSHVTVIERDEDACAGAIERVTASWERSGADVTEGLSRLAASTDPDALSSSTLVVEAVPEIFELKQSVLQRVEAAAPDAVLMSNTSSFSISKLASSLNNPAQFAGMHFFNPVPVSKLVEIVAGAESAPDTLTQAHEWVEAIGKTPITVQDSPGFASSRLGVSLALEAMRMLETGVGTAEDIDTAMELGYGHAAGPLKTTDIVGLDVRLAVAEYLESKLGERFAPPQILRDLVAAGKLGRKSGEGFYTW
ncbi:3-hydroxyacyl-CoA dehydrogenase family protein [Microbacterium esteraromaticum]|uniref:3-hydroxyacyl-CoA dehydrogenase family protein n=1 Tax=Microbacterium esteraromaticum TaxID=57043 RepID=UPI001C9556D7|nr:3-hydroxyacyl-CoA dehydrogenase family protein [Microbacterium esteraromaticum]MBY6062402.1 3-hydroxyacyl-CoA dehydrogenase family protein [Microbacterium esteraromaticum]